MNRLAELAKKIGSAFVTLWRWRWRFFWGAVVATAFGGALLYADYSRDEPETYYDDPEKQFMYGSTGGDRIAGIPIHIFQALPDLCSRYLPGEGLESLGLYFEPGMDRPVGTSKRRHLGFDRVSVNCALCHSGTWRESTADQRHLVLGMPANRLDLEGFKDYLVGCSMDEVWNPWQVIQAAEDKGASYDFIDRALLTFVVPAMREVLVLLNYRFRFFDYQTESGPGRFDTFSSAKALLNWPLDDLPPREQVGIVDYPSLWLQGQRRGMKLHWDGNNDSVEERNRSASFGSGAMPRTLDRTSLAVVASWLQTDAEPPPYPFERDPALSKRGAELYRTYCARCHGQNGRDFSGARVGKVERIEKIGTDPCRLDNYTYALAVDQNNLYAAYPAERFTRFRKTHGYANMPLDGVWLRAPYLHNGSVPTIRALLDRAEDRPTAFYRGYDVIDQDGLGFVADVPSEDGADFFRYETRCTPDPARGVHCAHEQNPENRHDDHRCVPGKWAGNSNRGHEGEEYGTHLVDDDKDAIVEYLKSF